ncbi:kelch-like protein 2 [Acyrthosiphon pisum]|uniref:Kelch-like protein diablo n=1 Tax=Acyrthosiphon pisum TaxID=7029 RepID=A0A8R2NQ49_ACYPI|nr:kelch-like protein 2 [Acyrthosiphon pisum]
MITPRYAGGLAVVNDNFVLYLGGINSESTLQSVNVLDLTSESPHWGPTYNMLSKRRWFGVGVIYNCMYAEGGFDSEQRLSSVECYHPSLNKWTPIADMCVRRNAVGVGVLDDVLYAVGGWDGHQVWSSVEAYSPSTGVWSTIPDMHLSRRGAGVAVLGGLLYVVGGYDGASVLDSVESYNPKTNKWTMITASMNVARSFAGAVAIDVPQYCKTY